MDRYLLYLVKCIKKDCESSRDTCDRCFNRNGVRALHYTVIPCGLWAQAVGLDQLPWAASWKRPRCVDSFSCFLYNDIKYIVQRCNKSINNLIKVYSRDLEENLCDESKQFIATIQVRDNNKLIKNPVNMSLWTYP